MKHTFIKEELAGDTELHFRTDLVKAELFCFVNRSKAKAAQHLALKGPFKEATI